MNLCNAMPALEPTGTRPKSLRFLISRPWGKFRINLDPPGVNMALNPKIGFDAVILELDYPEQGAGGNCRIVCANEETANMVMHGLNGSPGKASPLGSDPGYYQRIVLLSSVGLDQLLHPLKRIGVVNELKND